MQFQRRGFKVNGIRPVAQDCRYRGLEKYPANQIAGMTCTSDPAVVAAARKMQGFQIND